jgi:hypothetical protein
MSNLLLSLLFNVNSSIFGLNKLTNEDIPDLEDGEYGIKHHPSIEIYYKPPINIDLEKANNSILNDNDEPVNSTPSLATLLTNYINSLLGKPESQHIMRLGQMDTKSMQFIYDDFMDAPQTTELV